MNLAYRAIYKLPTAVGGLLIADDEDLALWIHDDAHFIFLPRSIGGYSDSASILRGKSKTHAAPIHNH